MTSSTLRLSREVQRTKEITQRFTPGPCKVHLIRVIISLILINH